jgi:hypothetical protein
MADVPTFFFSHARQDREAPGQYLLRFFKDLEIKVAQYGAVDLQERRLGTLDARVEQGADWDANLSEGLRTDKAFVAILTPLYFTRLNCGKELGAFLVRSGNLGVDQNGALVDAKNVMPIRWLPANAYAANTVRDSLIPSILRRIEDTPADDGGNRDNKPAIDRYRRNGMERCVSTGRYLPLLDLIAARIRDLPRLDPGPEVSFATARDAFTCEWPPHPAMRGAAAAGAAEPAPVYPPVVPQALSSIVAFYVTHRPVTPDPNGVDFADQLLAEPLPGAPAPADPELSALLADVRTAGVAEGFNVFHAAGNAFGPVTARPLLDRLANLSAKGVVTVLIVDPAVWSGAPAGPEAAAVEQIIGSRDWTGDILLPLLGEAIQPEAGAVNQLPARVLVLPREADARVTSLRRVFVSARGRVLRTSSGQAPDAERLPMLKGAGKGST